MTQEQYVSYEVAKLLKEKRFNEPCICYSYDKGMNNYFSKPRIIDNSNKDASYILLPTQQMAMRWLREVHNLIIEVRVKHHFRVFDGYYAGIVHLDGDVHYEYTPDEYSTYEEACEAAIKYCLEHLI